MTRADEIQMLKNRYRIYMMQRKPKAASFVLVRLAELMRRQLNSENKLDRKEARV